MNVITTAGRGGRAFRIIGFAATMLAAQVCAAEAQDGPPGGFGRHHGGGPHGPWGPPTVEERVRRLTHELDLTPAQAAKVREVFVKTDAERKGLLDAARAARDELREKLEVVRTKTENQIGEVLTPEQQKKLEEERSRRWAGGPGGRGGPGRFGGAGRMGPPPGPSR